MLLAIYHLHDRERLRARRETVTKSVVIGSSRDCDVVIVDDARVAAHHLRLAIDPPAIEPLEGEVLLDGKPVEGPTPVRLGAPIQIGDTIVKLRPSPIVAALHELDRTNPPNRRLLPPRPGKSARMPAEMPAQMPAEMPAEMPPEMPAEMLAGAPIATPPELVRRPRARRPSAPPPREPSSFPPPPAIWRPTLAADPTEQHFLHTLRDRPDDTATRMVYADWLDQHDRSVEATFVRIELRSDDPAIVRASELDWRAITSRAPIEDCRVGEGDPEAVQCPARWDGLAATRDERVRRCDVCSRPVRFCGTIGDAALAGRTGARAVFDVALDDVDAYGAYHDRQLELDGAEQDEVVSLPSIDTTPSLDDSDDGFFTLDDEAPPTRD